MGCRTGYNNKGEISYVLADNGKISRLFDDIKTKMKLSDDASIEAYRLATGPWMEKAYDGEYDNNNEPLFKDARRYLEGFADKLRFVEEFDDKLRVIADNHGMLEDGYFPRTVDKNAIREEIKQRGLRNTQLYETPGGHPFIAVSGTFYNPHKRHYYKHKDDAALRDWKVTNAIGNLISELGIQVEWTDKMSNDVIGRADAMNRIIQLAEGKMDPNAMTEEVLHIVVSMMRGTSEYAAMMNAIVTMDEYRKVVSMYKNDPEYQYYDGPNKGQTSYTKLQEEAVVKHLLNLLNEQQSEPSTWWEMLLDWVRRLFTSDKGVRASMTFRGTAQAILNQNLSDLNIDREIGFMPVDENVSEIFFRKVSVANPAKQQAIIDRLDALDAMQWKENDGRYFYTDALGVQHMVSNRVSDMVKKFYAEMFRDPEFDEINKKLYMDTGTKVHYFNQFILRDLRDGKRTMKKLMKTPDAYADVYARMVYKELKDNPEFEEYDEEWFELTASQFSELVKTVGHLYEHIMDIDEGAVIRLEQKLFDPERDLAGTVDVMVVHSDGTVSIYDYKTVKAKTFGSEQVPYWKLQGYDIQVGNYKNLAIKNLQLDKHDMRETRIIPISAEYGYNEQTEEMEIRDFTGSLSGVTRKTWEKIRLSREAEEKRYIGVISVGGETVPGDTDMNKFLKKLYRYKNELIKKLDSSNPEQKQKLRRRVERVQKIISDIVVLQHVDAALEDLQRNVNYINTHIMTMSEGELREYLALMGIYEEMYAGLKEEWEPLEEEYKKSSDVAKRELAENYNVGEHYLGLVKMGISELQIEIIRRSSLELGDEYDTDVDKMKILQGGIALDFIDKTWVGAGRLREPAIRVMQNIMREADIAAQTKFKSYETKIIKTGKAYDSWARGSGFSGQNLFNPLLNDNRMLVSPITKEFYEMRDRMMEEGRKKWLMNQDYDDELDWLETHIQFNEELWQKHYDEQVRKLIEEEGLDEMSKQFRRRIQPMLDANPENNPQAALFNKSYYNRRPMEPTNPVMKEYLTDEYKYLRQPGNEAALEYYEMWMEIMTEVDKMLGHNRIAKNFVPWLRMNMIDHMSMFFSSRGFNMKGGLFEALKVVETDQTMGVVNLSGEIVDDIPIIGLQQIWNPLTVAEETRLRQRLEGETDEKGVPLTGERLEAEFIKEKFRIERENALGEKSVDLTQSLLLFVASAINYEQMKAVEDKVLMVREVLNTDYYNYNPTNKYGQPLKDKFTRLNETIEGSSEEVKTIADMFIKMNMYGQYHQGRDYKTPGGLSARKAVDAVHSYLSAKSLGLNYYMGLASHFNALFNSKWMATMDEYFSKEAWKESVDGVVRTDPKDYALIAFMGQEGKTSDRALKQSGSWFKRLMNKRTLFFFYRGGGQRRNADPEYIKQLKEAGYDMVDDPLWGDDYISNRIKIAIAREWVVDSDGKLRKKNSLFDPPKDPKAPSVRDLFDHKALLSDQTWSKENIPFKAPMTWDNYVRFERIVGLALHETVGKMNLDTKNTWGTSIQGAIAGKFRDWMPGLITPRYQTAKWDNILNSFREGYVKGAFKEVFMPPEYILEMREVEGKQLESLFSWYLLPVTKKFFKLGAEVLSMGYGKFKVDKKLAEYYYNKMLEDNPDIDTELFTLDRFIDYRQKQFKTTANEIRWAVLLLMLLTSALKAAGGDEEDSPYMLQQLYTVSRRTYMELNFFWSPSTAMDIIRQPVAMVSIVKDLYKSIGNFYEESVEAIGVLPENQRDRSPYFYYTAKQIPVLNQIMTLALVFPRYKDNDGTIVKLLEEWGVFDNIGAKK